MHNKLTPEAYVHIQLPWLHKRLIITTCTYLSTYLCNNRIIPQKHLQGLQNGNIHHCVLHLHTPPLSSCPLPRPLYSKDNRLRLLLQCDNDCKAIQVLLHKIYINLPQVQTPVCKTSTADMESRGLGMDVLFFPLS